MSSTLQQQARALGDPTRHEIFRYIADSDDSVDVAELTAHLGLNHNAIRQHLAKLLAAGLITEAVSAPSGRGRPRLRYHLDPSSDSRWGVTGPYERLSMLLGEVLRTGDSPVAVGRRAAMQQRHGNLAAKPLDAFVEQMARLGFEPEVRHRGDSIDMAIQSCPFASAVLTDPDTVCDLHLGLAQGMAESVGGITIDELTPRDPQRATCRLRCHLTTPGEAVS